VSTDPYRGTYVNLARTRARGVEAALEVAPVSGLGLRGEYTFLDGEIRVSPSDFDPVYAVGRQLLRRPRHQGAFSCRLSTERFSIEATMLLVGRRADSDFVGLGLMENDGYARLDARIRLRLVRGVDLLAAADNLLDRSYQEALGYPALGRSLRVGLRLQREARRR
jgi:vitamin B12 transporter